MNFNYDLMTWIEYFIGAFACAVSMFLTAIIIVRKKLKDIKFYRCLLLIPFSIIIVYYSTTFDNIMKIFCSLITFYLIYKLILRQKNIACITYSAINYIVFIISETILALIIFASNHFFKIDLSFLLSKSIIANVIIGIFAFFISIIVRNKFVTYAEKIINKKILLMLQAILVVFIGGSAINYLYIHNWTFNYEYILDIVVIAGSIILMQSLLNQYIKNKEIVDKYSLLQEYMKTSADLVEKYSSTVHKYKNNLIAIKGYYKNNNQDGNDYIDSLLEGYKTKKYSWFSKINHIPFDSIRYLIYYKLSKAEELNLKIIVNVDKEVNKIQSNILDISHTSTILEIVGEYFDNAVYASNESNEKELIFNIYVDDNKIIFEIANTFLNNVDLNLIYKNGYTTKGKGHGLGLYEVDKSIKSHEYIEGNININENYFISKIILNLNYFNK